jgi:hypothetical protein
MPRRGAIQELVKVVKVKSIRQSNSKVRKIAAI